MSYKIGSRKESILHYANGKDSFTTKDVMVMFNLPYTAVRMTMTTMVYEGTLKLLLSHKGEQNLWKIAKPYVRPVIFGEKINCNEINVKEYTDQTYTVFSITKPLFVIVPYDEHLKNNPVTKR